MSGVSLFRLLDYSIRTATFTDDHNNEADQLLQVAGLRITYNENIQQGLSRLVAVDVWDRILKNWKALNSASLYTFATSSYECGQMIPYPILTGADGSFTIGQGGVVGEALLQDVIKDYLGHLTEPYNTTLEGRIVGTPLAAVNATLNLIEDENDCLPTEYFSTYHQTCKECPSISHVTFSDEQVNFQYQLGRVIEVNVVNNSLPDDATPDKLIARILLVNKEHSNISVIPKLIPTWLRVIHVTADSIEVPLSETQNHLVHIPAGTSVAFRLIAEPGKSQLVGTIVGSVSFGVVGSQNDDTDPGSARCDQVNQDLTFDASLKILPQEDSNHLGDIRFLGLSCMAVAQLSAVGFAVFVRLNRNTRILKTMQTHFLKAICLGIFIMSTTILPLSFDDNIITPEQCNGMCASIPWLFSTGAIIVFTILFAKLWRINRLFGAQRFHRLVVTERDVLGPFLLLFATNVALLTAWTIVDPLQWTRITVPGEEWKTYGSCASNGIGYIFMGLILFLLGVALVMACHQAYRARNISDEFSESKNLGLALFTWLQVLLVGVPTLFLVNAENFTARYFIVVGLLFVLSETMLLVIFVPLVKGVLELKKNPSIGNSGGNRPPEAAGHNFGGDVAVSGISGGAPNGDAACRPEILCRPDILPVRVRNMSSTMPTELDSGDGTPSLSGASMNA
jgi:7 transmembrane sweet-taste receptor of 3 GCPR